MSSRRQMLEFLSLSRLPSAFQEVEYIESSGTQYIDTGYIFNTTKIKYECSFSAINSSSSQTFIGAVNNTARDIVLQKSSTNYRVVKEDLIVNSDVVIDEQKHNFIVIRNGVQLSLQVDKTTNNGSGGPDNRTGIRTYIFAYNNNGTASGLTTGKCYSPCKLYDNDVLVRDFVPCYRKADNVEGLYDLVNGVFYTNAGTGTFIAGGNV